MKERNIKLLIAYDGTDFHGWQRQGTSGIFSKTKLINNSLKETNSHLVSSPVPCPLSPTVQGVIEDALAQMHKHPVSLTGAGRTDAGVHAAGQVANFYTDIDSIPAKKFVPALNSLLSKNVRILEAEEVPNDFHARFSAFSRTYRYYFLMRQNIFPHESRYNLHLKRYPKLNILNSYCKIIFGETDCAIFAGAGDTALTEGKSAKRYIYNAYFYIEKDRLVFEITANAFLKNMVRSVAGTFLFYEEKGTDQKELQKIISSGERKMAGPTLPPDGLFLWKVDY